MTRIKREERRIACLSDAGTWQPATVKSYGGHSQITGFRLPEDQSGYEE